MTALSGVIRPGRFARTAGRLREGAAGRMDLGVTAWAYALCNAA